MLATKIIIIICATIVGLFYYAPIKAEPISSNRVSASISITDELNICQEQLAKYRKFLLQAILSIEDVCDAYNARPFGANDIPALFHYYQPTETRTEIWAFFKLLMAQFNDMDFANVIRDAVIERCRIKSQLQRDEKRNSVVLGKKQRFHSWGGKRASLLDAGANNNALTTAEATTNGEHSIYYF